MKIKTLPHHLFELAVALTWVVVGTSYLLSPAMTLATSPVDPAVGNVWPAIWGMMEVLGGFVTLMGLGKQDPGLRATGLCVLGAGLGMHFIGAVSMGLDLRDFVYLIMGAACLLRVLFIHLWEG